MPNIYVHTSGSFTAAKEIFVKHAGDWKTVKEVWIKQGGSWVQTFPENSGSRTYTSGSGTFIVPNGIYNLTIKYPTTSGITTTNLSVTPGEEVFYNIGGFGATSTFGSITAPIWDQQISTFAGNVDQTLGLYSVWGVATARGNTYSGSGNSTDLYNGATAAGCYYREYNEGEHGDLSATISITTALSSTITNSIRVYLSAFSGRGSYTIVDQPSSSNSYRATIALSDPDYSEGYYTYTMNLQQAVPITVSW